MYDWKIGNKHLKIFFIQSAIFLLVIASVAFIVFKTSNDFKNSIGAAKMKFSITEVDKKYAAEIKYWGLFDSEGFEKGYFIFFDEDGNEALDTSTEFREYFKLNKNNKTKVLNMFFFAAIILTMDVGHLIYTLYARRKPYYSIANAFTAMVLFVFAMEPYFSLMWIAGILFIISIIFAIIDYRLIKKDNYLIDHRKVLE